jgi:hypothetical protein
MKYLIITLTGILFCLSCAQEDCEVKTAGFITDWPEATYTIGTNESVELWKKYVELHNQKDIDGIMELNWDSIQIYGPNGEYINGSEEHQSFLEQWFNSGTELNWSFTWATAVKVVDAPGEWVMSGIDFVRKDSVLSVESQIFSALVGPDKVYQFYVKTAKVPLPEENEDSSEESTQSE